MAPYKDYFEAVSSLNSILVLAARESRQLNWLKVVLHQARFSI